MYNGLNISMLKNLNCSKTAVKLVQKRRPPYFFLLFCVKTVYVIENLHIVNHTEYNATLSAHFL